jgi:hypothetical protein
LQGKRDALAGKIGQILERQRLFYQALRGCGLQIESPFPLQTAQRHSIPRIQARTHRQAHNQCQQRENAIFQSVQQ